MLPTTARQVRVSTSGISFPAEHEHCLTVSPDVRLGNGVEITLDAGLRVVADGKAPDGDINILSHAHGDHLYSEPPEAIVCSDTTAALAAARRDAAIPPITSHDRVTLIDAGHVPGSRAALIEDTDTSILYTGDISTRDRFYLEGFTPPPADILIIESTYGKPDYTLPPQANAEHALIDWLNETIDNPVIVFGYTLGRAQEVQLLGMQSDRSEIYVTDAVSEINSVIESHVDVSFDVSDYDEDVELEAGDMLVLPSQTNRLSFVERIVAETGALTAGVSGWAVEDSYKYRGDFDETFAISDHCGFTELLDVVDAVDPSQVYTHHGFADELADEIRSKLGYPAQSLKRNQATLGDF